MKSFFKEFKAFAMKGNVLDMAVGVIIGGAFGKIVTSLVNNILMPFIGLLIGGVNFTDLKLILGNVTYDSSGKILTGAVIEYGIFLQNVVDFLIVAFSIFLMLKAINKLTNKKAKEEPKKEEPKQPTTEELLSEILTVLKEK